MQEKLPQEESKNKIVLGALIAAAAAGAISGCVTPINPGNQNISDPYPQQPEPTKTTEPEKPETLERDKALVKVISDSISESDKPKPENMRLLKEFQGNIGTDPEKVNEVDLEKLGDFLTSLKKEELKLVINQIASGEIARSLGTDPENVTLLTPKNASNKSETKSYTLFGKITGIGNSSPEFLNIAKAKVMEILFRFFDKNGEIKIVVVNGDFYIARFKTLTPGGVQSGATPGVDSNRAGVPTTFIKSKGKAEFIQP